jgi:hypothetical protein
VWTGRPDLGPIQWVPGALSLGIERPGREADHLPPSGSDVGNVWIYTSIPPLPNTPSLRGARLKHRCGLDARGSG